MSKGGGTVGYRYIMALHMGLCRGPVDELKEIRVGDKTAWSGSLTQTQAFVINAWNLFGGDEKEGGIQGGAAVLMGEATQAVNDVIAGMLGGLVPAFRHVATLWFYGRICANNPYPKPWAVRVRRSLKGWDGDVWYPQKATVWLEGGAIRAMNPAHIIYEALTNRSWGRGFDRDLLSDEAFTSTANRLCDEGFGLCLRYNRQDDVDKFIQGVLDHIGGRVGINRGTGLFELRLLRDDYTTDDLAIFDYDSGLLSVEADEAAAQPNATNEIVVIGFSPVAKDKIQVRVQNNAAIQASGEVVSETLDMPGLPTAELCARVAQRELNARSGGWKRFKLKFDRRGWRIQPGVVFRILAPDRGIDTPLVVRAGRVEDSVLTDGTITVDAIEDVFGMPSTAPVQREAGGWVPPDQTAVVPAHRKVFEAPYRDLARTLSTADLAALDEATGFVNVLAVQPTGLSLNYRLMTAATGEDYADRGNIGDWCPGAALQGDIGHHDTVIVLSDGSNLDLVTAGGAALIGDEIVRVDAIDAAAGTATVARGCADTIPQAHAAGTRVWFFDDYAANDGREYAAAETVGVKILTRTSADELDEGEAPIDSVTLASRQIRPLPPGNVTVNGRRYGEVTATTGDIVVGWAHRDRVAQDDQLVAHDAGDVGPEAGTTYTVRVYDGATLIRTASGLTGTSWTWDEATQVADAAPQTVTIKLKSVRDGYDSAAEYAMTFDRFATGATGFGLAFDEDFGGTP